MHEFFPAVPARVVGAHEYRIRRIRFSGLTVAADIHEIRQVQAETGRAVELHEFRAARQKRREVVVAMRDRQGLCERERAARFTEKSDFVPELRLRFSEPIGDALRAAVVGERVKRVDHVRDPHLSAPRTSVRAVSARSRARRARRARARRRASKARGRAGRSATNRS